MVLCSRILSAILVNSKILCLGFQEVGWDKAVNEILRKRGPGAIIADFLILVILLLGLFIYHSGFLLPKVVTEECPFCTLYPSDGLSLIDTQTGATSTIAIWLGDLEKIAEVGDWETQLKNGDHSTFSFIRIGQNGYCQTHMGGVLLIFTPEEVNTTAYFCQEHAALAIAPYVLVDLKLRDTYEVYPIRPGESFSFRHYSVSVEQEGETYEVSIESNLFEKEVAQWRAERENGRAD